tara:strand:- start:2860 stop:4158 length:1299 start_codon:yes stop_codon:yes gene_type:complete
MGIYKLKLPKMGESVAEATLTNWLKEVGDSIDIDDSVLEIATDKVDSDIPSEVKGILIEKKFKENDIIQVGQVIALIEAENYEDLDEKFIASEVDSIEIEVSNNSDIIEKEIDEIIENKTYQESEIQSNEVQTNNENKFYSPLVKNIAKEEGISFEELSLISGTGSSNRVTKSDILNYISKNKDFKTDNKTPISEQNNDQIIELSRMGKIIAENMILSKKTSAHVQTFFEADVTKLCEWRDRIKIDFEKKENEKLTYTPMFILAVINALKKFPLLNSIFDGEKIIQKKDINIGMATALENGDLIVPVIANANHLNLIGLAKSVNDLSSRARKHQLTSDEISNGTFTVTNIGNFGSLTGTPIINQPQLGIIALGAIRKVPSVIETSEGDYIGIRKKMILAHSYDHRVINGALGGNFIKEVATFLEDWDNPFEI